jgi:hypothetical protein
MEPDVSLPRSQQPATYPYAGSVDSLLEYIIEEKITRQQQLPFTVVKMKSCNDGYILFYYVFGTNVAISIFVFLCEFSYLTLLILYNVFNCIKRQLIILLDLQFTILLLLCSP